jgi:hypothetical protein
VDGDATALLTKIAITSVISSGYTSTSLSNKLRKFPSIRHTFMMVPLKGGTNLDTERFTYSAQGVLNLYDMKYCGVSMQYQDPLDFDIDIVRIVNGKLEVIPKSIG